MSKIVHFLSEMSLFCLCILSVAVFSHAWHLPEDEFKHDYVKDGRNVDGPFPSNLRNIPYLCYQAPSKGPCGLMLKAWFFDIVTRKCMPMYYSGCGGNENRFESHAHCVSYCERRKPL